MEARTGQWSLPGVLLTAIVATLVLAMLPRPATGLLIQAGAVGPFIADGETAHLRNFFGFHEPEIAGPTTFRWTTGEGGFVVRSGAHLGAPLRLTLRVCGCHTGDAGPRMQVRANGITLADTQASARWGEWRRYQLLLPARRVPYSPDVLVEILSDRTRNVSTGQWLGVAFDYAELRPLQASQVAFPYAAAAGLGLLIGSLVGPALLRGYPPVSALLFGLLGLGLVAAQGLLYQPHPLPAQIFAAGLLLALGLAFGTTCACFAPAGGGQKQRNKRTKEQTTNPTSNIQHPKPVLPLDHLGNREIERSKILNAWPLLIFLLLAWLVVAPQLLGVWMLDDAFISFRYARNALLGYGFVFNPGERVEGYTNFLWTALFVPVIGGGVAPGLASQAVTLLLALIIAALTWASARRLAGGWPAVAALALLVASPPFVLYTARGSGMETALFTLLALVGVVAYLAALRRPTTDDRPPTTTIPRHPVTLSPVHPFTGSPLHFIILSGICFGLAAMTRPEGVLLTGLTGLHLVATVAYMAIKQRNPRSASFSLQPSAFNLQPSAFSLFLSAFALGFLALFGPYFLWRYSYYGYLLPNTFYAKVGTTGAQAWRGAEYAASFGWAQWPLLALAAVGLAGAVVGWRDGPGERGTEEQGNRGTEEQRNRGTEEQRNRGTEEQENRSTTERQNRRTAEERHKTAGVLLRTSATQNPTSNIQHPTWPGVRSAVYLALLVAGYTAYIVAVGGDHFPLYRFFVPLLPLLALLAALGLRALADPSTTDHRPPTTGDEQHTGAMYHTPADYGRYPRNVLRGYRLLTILLVAIGLAWSAPQLYESRTLNPESQVWGENSVVEKNREIGLWLRANTSPGTLIATGIAGALPYYAERPVLDSLGLNDLHIARLEVATMGQGVAGSEKTDVTYVLNRRPAYIPFNSSEPFKSDPRFDAEYRSMLVRGPEGRGFRLYRRVEQQ